MAILVICRCGQQFHTPDENAGRRANCPECGRELVIPKATEPLEGDVLGLDPIASVVSGNAITSVCLGLLSLGCLVLAGLPAIVFGWLGLRDITQGHGRVRGTWLAVTGIVLGVVGCLLTIALLIPAFHAAREGARRAECTHNLKQIGLAMHNFLSQHGTFPGAAIVDKKGRPLLSWRVAILPYLGKEEAALFSRFHLNEPWDSPHNSALLHEIPSVYRCPSHFKLPSGYTNYEVVVGPKTIFTGGKPVAIQAITDGTSNTILFVEARRPVPWTSPEDLPLDMGVMNSGMGSEHPGGFHVVLADGSVKFVSDVVSQSVLAKLLTKDSGEVIPWNAAW